MNKYLTTKLDIKGLTKGEFEGFGSIFGNIDLGGDVVMPGAFKRTLAEHNSEGTLPMMFWMHDPSRIPGKWIEMEETSKGLYVKGKLADTELGREIHALLSMKAVSGLSIGYMSKDTDYTDDGVRLLKDVDLIETSVVSLPMNPKAQIVHAKSRLSERGEYVPTFDEIALLKRDCEQFFYAKGFSRKLAKVYVSNLFRESSETLDPADETLVKDDTTPSKTESSATPEELDLKHSLEIFEETNTAYELSRIFKQAFG